jgi:transcriptional regulator with XRE-family HTH domain
MKPNELIRARREELGLKVADVASKAALGGAAYRDIESYEDEAFTTVPLGTLRSITEVLGLDLLSMFGIECHLCSTADADVELFRLPRNELTSKRRTALGLTREQLGNRIGFETVAIEEMEQDPDFLERWSVELIQQLAIALKIPMHVLLRVPCSKCRRGAGSGPNV